MRRDIGLFSIMGMASLAWFGCGDATDETTLQVGSEQTVQEEGSLADSADQFTSQSINKRATELSGGTLIHEIKLSNTRRTTFWELAPGEVIVIHEGKIGEDPLPPEEFRSLAPLEVAERMSTEPPPARLREAQERADSMVEPSSVDGERLEGGPGSAESEMIGMPPEQSFLWSGWWEGVACDLDGYTQTFILEGDTYYPYVGCWA